MEKVIQQRIDKLDIKFIKSVKDLGDITFLPPPEKNKRTKEYKEWIKYIDAKIRLKALKIYEEKIDPKKQHRSYLNQDYIDDEVRRLIIEDRKHPYWIHSPKKPRWPKVPKIKLWTESLQLPEKIDLTQFSPDGALLSTRQQAIQKDEQIVLDYGDTADENKTGCFLSILLLLIPTSGLFILLLS